VTGLLLTAPCREKKIFLNPSQITENKLVTKLKSPKPTKEKLIK
jgi:hypothetical protein